MIEPEGKFIQVERQVLSRDFVVDAGDAAFQERPDVFHAVAVDVSRGHVLLGVIDRPMHELRAVQPEVRGKLVGMDGSVALGALADKLSQTPSGDIL